MTDILIHLFNIFLLISLLGVTLNCSGTDLPAANVKGGTVTLPRAEAPESRQIELAPVNLTPGRVLLKLAGVRHSRRSFEVRFFVDSPDADATTPVEDNERYGGSFIMYGHGMPGEKAVGEAAVLEGFVPEAGKELEPFEAVVDITKAVTGLNQGTPMHITLVVRDENGNPMPHSTFKFDRASLAVGN